jgi:hypothetical protein
VNAFDILVAGQMLANLTLFAALAYYRWQCQRHRDAAEAWKRTAEWQRIHAVDVSEKQSSG